MKPIKLPARSDEPQPNPDFVTLLEGALPLMWDGVGERDLFHTGDERYICLALSEVDTPDEFPFSSLRDLTGLIDARLDDGTFETWAHDQGVIDLPSIQAGRKAWILDLIEELS